MVQINPVKSVYAKSYKSWTIGIEKEEPHPEMKSFQYVAFRNGLVMQKCGYASMTEALNAAMIQVDIESSWEDGFAAARANDFSYGDLSDVSRWSFGDCS